LDRELMIDIFGIFGFKDWVNFERQCIEVGS
jgi:hypothetical protein